LRDTERNSDWERPCKEEKNSLRFSPAICFWRFSKRMEKNTHANKKKRMEKKKNERGNKPLSIFYLPLFHPALAHFAFASRQASPFWKKGKKERVLPPSSSPLSKKEWKNNNLPVWGGRENQRN